MKKPNTKESIRIILEMAKLAHKQVIKPLQEQKEQHNGKISSWSIYQEEPWIHAGKAIKNVERILREEPERFLEV